MRKTLILLAVLVLIGGGVALAASGGSSELPRDPERPDCPGIIECPLTGEPICADECPLRRDAGAEADTAPCCCDKK